MADYDIINAGSVPAATQSDVTSGSVFIFGSDGELKKAGAVVMKGENGNSVELRISSGYMQWREVGTTSWNNIIAMSALKGADGKELEIRVSAGNIQTRLTGGTWANLIAMSELKGDTGKSAYELWKAEPGNEDKTYEEYLAFNRQPATEAAAEVRSEMNDINAEWDDKKIVIEADITAIKEDWNTTLKPAIESATEDAVELSEHPNYISPDDYYVYAWNITTKAYDKTDVYVKGEGFTVDNVYTSIAAMEADIANAKENRFYLINSDDVENPDNAKLYTFRSGAFQFLVDMSGAIGFTGKTAQFIIGQTLTTDPGGSAGVSIEDAGVDGNGNPVNRLNFSIPRGFTGPMGKPLKVNPDTGNYLEWNENTQSYVDSGNKAYSYADEDVTIENFESLIAGKQYVMKYTGGAKFELIEASAVDWNDIQNKPTSMPASDVSAWAKAATKPAYAYSEISGKPDLSLKADLVSGKVPSTQLPSYVDDVIEGTLTDIDEFKDVQNNVITPESGKIYVDVATDKQYRWGGSLYTEISKSLAIGETGQTAFAGDKGKVLVDKTTWQETHTSQTTGSVDCATGKTFTITASGALTLSLSNLASILQGADITIRVVSNDATVRTITLPTSDVVNETGMTTADVTNVNSLELNIKRFGDVYVMKGILYA